VTFFEQFSQTVCQRLQRHANATNPFGQCGACNRRAVPLANLFNPLQRKVIQICLNDHPGM